MRAAYTEEAACPLLHVQTLVNKRRWDWACDEYEAVWPGFKRYWEKNRANPRKSKVDWLAEYRSLEAHTSFDERSKVVPSKKSSDELEASVASRRWVSAGCELPAACCQPAANQHV